MQEVKDLIGSCYITDVLKYLLLNTEESERKELISIYRNIYYNLIDDNMPIKHSERVFTEVRPKAENPSEYEFYYTTIKDCFECSEKEYISKYKKADFFTDEKLPELLGMYYCEGMFFCEDVEFVGELLRKIAMEADDIKKVPDTSHKHLKRQDYKEIKTYIKNMGEYAADIRKEIVDYGPKSPRLTLMRKYFSRYNFIACFGYWRGGYDTYLWPEVVIDPHFAVFTKYYLENREIISPDSPDAEKIEQLRATYKDIVLRDYFRGFLVSFQNRIVIEYPRDVINEVKYINDDEVDVKNQDDKNLPDIYVIDSDNYKTNIADYSVHRLLTMPIDITEGMDKDRAMAYLMFYLTYPEEYMGIKNNVDSRSFDVMESDVAEDIDYEMCDKFIKEFYDNDDISTESHS